MSKEKVDNLIQAQVVRRIPKEVIDHCQEPVRTFILIDEEEIRLGGLDEIGYAGDRVEFDFDDETAWDAEGGGRGNGGNLINRHIVAP